MSGQLKHALATLDRRDYIWHVVSVFDASALRVWEHFRRSRGKVWQLDEHLQRGCNSSMALSIDNGSLLDCVLIVWGPE